VTWSVCWIVLPNGLAGDVLKLSIVVAPASSALVDWHTVAADLQPRRLVSPDGTIDLPLTINSTDVTSISHAASATGTMAADIAEAAGELAELERSMAKFSPTAWPSVGERAALAVLGDMVVTRQRGRVPADAIARLAQRSAVADHGDVEPFGLRIDATVPRFEGDHAIRVVGADGRALDGPVQVEQPWTRVRSSGSGWSVVPRDGGRRYCPEVTLTRIAVAELSNVVDTLAEELAAAEPERRVELPPLDDGAFTLAMRRATSDDSGGVLHAENVTRGIRAEVALAGGPLHAIGEGPVITWDGTGGPAPRYGDHVGFCIRAVDLAGNVMAGSEQVVSAGRYLRRSAVDAPSVVGTAPDEVLDVVVRSDDDGRPIGPHVEWTIVPPELDPLVASRHEVDSAADPAAAGLALIGLAGRSQPIVIPFAGVGSKIHLRLSIRAALGDEVTGDDVVVDHDVGSDLVELLVPPGVSASFELASPVAGSALQDLYVGDLPPATLLDGSAVMRCRRRRVSVSHVVQRPALEAAPLVLEPRIGVPA